MGRTRLSLLFLVLVLVLSYGVLGMSGRYNEEEEWGKVKRGEEGRGDRREDWGRGERGDEPEEWGRGERGKDWGKGERREEGRGEREEEEEQEGRRERRGEGGEEFLLRDSEQVVKTDAGVMKVVRSYGGRHEEGPMRIGFITMEPRSLFVPQYLDSSLIIFIRRGEAKVGFIYKDEFAERRLKSGDIYRIPAGSAFYLVNTGEGQRLQIIFSIDITESSRFGTFQSFFIGGGRYPKSVLSGFDSEILENAFNVSSSDLRELLSSQEHGPIMFIPESRSPSVWANFLQLKEQDKQKHLKRMVNSHEATDEDEEKETSWSWRKFLGSLFENRDKKPDDRKTRGKSPDSYNLYDRKADFRNNYGWSVALDESDYSPLKRSGVSIFLVNLTAGSMMAPHLNPRATEYGIVLRGAGTVQVVYPNGSSAMNTEVREGDVFFVPRYFPFCQIASRTGPMEFFGFTTSARKNRPQFLVGSNSILRSMRGPELAAAFGVTQERLGNITDAQREGVILPSAGAATPKMEEEKMKVERLPEVIKSFGKEMMFD
ncbi:hypothetical protein UlMin_013639 [Ulmus minor]